MGFHLFGPLSLEVFYLSTKSIWNDVQTDVGQVVNRLLTCGRLGCPLGPACRE
jgi:hypothetical protein